MSEKKSSNPRADFVGPYADHEFKIGDVIKWRTLRPYAAKGRVTDPNPEDKEKIKVVYLNDHDGFRKRVLIRKDKVIEILSTVQDNTNA